jgi:hypothetical protein
VASITPRVRFRQLPEPYTYPDSPPSSPAVVNLCHPANGLAFLALPAYVLFCQSPLQFGTHSTDFIRYVAILMLGNSPMAIFLHLGWQRALVLLRSCILIGCPKVSSSGKGIMCLVTGWKDSLTTSHVIPHEEETWVSRIHCPSCTCC